MFNIFSMYNWLLTLFSSFLSQTIYRFIISLKFCLREPLQYWCVMTFSLTGVWFSPEFFPMFDDEAIKHSFYAFVQNPLLFVFRSRSLSSSLEDNKEEHYRATVVLLFQDSDERKSFEVHFAVAAITVNHMPCIVGIVNIWKTQVWL